ncbi:cytochrome c3 family protein [Singulisphaera sp. PoT]|uniref:cytochrome c3 family protein n=1 Tax=Singulisphaera sp. PoT TaxID=3411797 RepID=UPI003BF4E0C5
MQVFPSSTNTLARVSIFGAIFFAAGVLGVVFLIFRSPYVTSVDVVRDQPIPFSHEHHVTALGIDCRYCHTSVETSSFAGIPATETCMSCHSQIWLDSPMLEPVRVSMRNNEPIRWTRVHELPDYAYFNHSIHVNKGVGCVSCHGRVDEMPLMKKAEPMTMEWCLSCHRAPEKHLRPRDQVFNMSWKAPEGDQLALGRELVKKNHIPVDRLTNCYVCHR